jgi:trk system potassium uptake protein TrkA
MKIIVIGYGRVGSQFVKKFDRQANQVTVVDKERSVMSQPDVPKDVRFLIGNAIDEDLLREAGAESADVILALTRDENTNLMIAQIARVVFNVPKVVAVVYDPQREAYFHAAGIETLAVAVAGADILAERLTGQPAAPGLTRDVWQPSGAESSQVPLRSLEAAGGSFYVIVVGGGLVGYYLGRALLRNGHEVTIIENDPDTYEMVSQQIDCPVLLGDGSATAVLERAGASRANLMCAVTNHDQDNLIACQVAKYRFGIPKTIARVKNPKNEAVMRRLGVDATVSSTGIITDLIQNELPAIPVLTLANLSSCGAEIIEYHLTPTSPVVGKPARKVTLPPNCSMIGVVRGKETVTCFDSTVFTSGDTLVALVRQEQAEAVRKILLGS